ncbi:MAG TPA: YggT family protein, partial [Usitatibacter sp.]
MLTEAILLVLNAVFDLFILAAMVRFWMQAFRAPVFNPLGQFAIALTDWAVKPLRRVVPGAFKLDWASLIAAGALEFVLEVLTLLLMGGSPVENPSVLSVLLFISFVRLVRYSIYVFMGALIILVVLSWVAPRHPVMPFFDALTRPFMRPARRMIPAIGGIDISPLFVFLFFQILLM